MSIIPIGVVLWRSSGYARRRSHQRHLHDSAMAQLQHV